MLTSVVTPPYILLARSFFVILGCFAVLWGLTELPAFWRETSIKGIATQIIAGAPFKIETLTHQVPIIDRIRSSAYCRPAALQSAALIELRRWEASASAKDRQHSDEEFKSLGNVIRGSLSCAPADPFLWLALYSVEVNEQGPKPDYLKYLRLSYRLGPYEGWIASKRNPLAFGAFQQLPPDLREDVIDEFFAMVHDGNFSGQAAEILIGPAWPERELISSRLTRLSDYDRRRFADELDRRGYDLNVPGVGLAPRDSHRFAPEIRVPQ